MSATRRKGPIPHHFREDTSVVDFGRKWCLDCPLPEGNEAVHGESAIAAEEERRAGWLAQDQRRTGER